jgi:hypothetical protein
VGEAEGDVSDGASMGTGVPRLDGATSVPTGAVSSVRVSVGLAIGDGVLVGTNTSGVGDGIGEKVGIGVRVGRATLARLPKTTATNKTKTT